MLQDTVEQDDRGSLWKHLSQTEESSGGLLYKLHIWTAVKKTVLATSYLIAHKWQDR